MVECETASARDTPRRRSAARITQNRFASPRPSPVIPSSSLHRGLSGWRSLSAETVVNLARRIGHITGRLCMDLQQLIHLIRAKVVEGRLPQNTFSGVTGRAGNNEICLACNEPVARNQLVVEGIGEATTAVHFHIGCFYCWNAERASLASLARAMAAGMATASPE